MCRALKILCAAPTPERLAELKRATVTVHWELIGGATSVDELAAQIEEWNPDVVVLDKGFGSDGEARARKVKETVRIVVVEAADAESIRQAILGLPQPGGPVRT
jgi:chemotaxis response regulator CheB